MKEEFILLVEDNKDDEELTLHALKKANLKYKVLVVRDGEEALDFLYRTGKYQGRNVLGMPKVVFLDIKLPKVDGLEVLRRIRESTQTRLLPVILFTSSKGEKDILEGYTLGANSYICKPMDMNEFTRAVQLLGGYWSSLNETPWSVHP